VYSRFVAPLSAEEERAYLHEASAVAERLGVLRSDLPHDVPELRTWMAWMIEGGRVAVTPEALRIARTVLYPSRILPRAAWDVAHLISLATLPDALRHQYGIRWSPARDRGVDRLAAITRRSLPLVPAPLRFVPQARAAERRVRRAAARSPQPIGASGSIR
jgi:uncharacterized protein (DUF2236 family)